MSSTKNKKNQACGDGTGVIVNINQKSSLNQHNKKLGIQSQGIHSAAFRKTLIVVRNEFVLVVVVIGNFFLQ